MLDARRAPPYVLEYVMPPCPVCNRTMIHTVDGIWSCPPRKISFAKLNTTLEIRHASFFYEGDKCTYQNIISGEYSFKIWNSTEQQKTEIFVLQKKEYRYKSKLKEFHWVKILEIPAAVSLPWNNPAKVADRVKTYIIFS